ncbi:MAG: response regulator [Nitrospira defluvii]|nr:response regulator [Nitrospira defluvii]
MMQPGSSKTLLVVDSCPETQALTLEQAKARGLSVITAPDPHGAMAMLNMTVPDVVLSDLCLPERTGLAMIHEIRRRCSQTVLIAMAEQGNDATMLEALRAGAIDFLHKPIMGAQLGTALDRALQAIPQTFKDVPGIEHVEYRLVIGTDPAHVEACVSWLIEKTAMRLPEIQRLHLRATLIELILNAVEHGSLEIFYQEKHEALGHDRYDTLIAERRRNPRFATRRVIVRTCYDKAARSTRYTITDEGTGFKWDRFLTRSDEPCDSCDANGRGVFLAKAFFPDLTYNERGTEVTFSVPLP